MADTKTKKRAVPAAKRTGKKAAPTKRANRKSAPRATESDSAAQEQAQAMAQALLDMIKDGATDPIAFFVSSSDPLGRELIELQGQDVEPDSLVPVVLDSAAVRRYAMLTIADELLWRNTKPR